MAQEDGQDELEKKEQAREKIRREEGGSTSLTMGKVAKAGMRDLVVDPPL